MWRGLIDISDRRPLLNPKIKRLSSPEAPSGEAYKKGSFKGQKCQSTISLTGMGLSFYLLVCLGVDFFMFQCNERSACGHFALFWILRL